MTDAERIQLVIARLLSAAGDEPAWVLLTAMQSLQIALAQLMPADRFVISEAMRQSAALVDALSDTTGEEAAAIVRQCGEQLMVLAHAACRVRH